MSYIRVWDVKWGFGQRSLRADFWLVEAFAVWDNNFFWIFKVKTFTLEATKVLFCIFKSPDFRLVDTFVHCGVGAD